MNPNLLNAFVEITGRCPKEIQFLCVYSDLDPQTLLEFYMHHNRFPTLCEEHFIIDTGLPNFNFLCISGIIPA